MDNDPIPKAPKLPEAVDFSKFSSTPKKDFPSFPAPPLPPSVDFSQHPVNAESPTVPIHQAPPLPRNPWESKSSQPAINPEVAQAPAPEETVQQKTDLLLGELPPELQESVREFYRDVAETIVSQQTDMSEDQVETKVTSDRVDYYKGRLAEVLDSGFLNPHMNPPKKITE